jgi:hypothetical protein
VRGSRGGRLWLRCARFSLLGRHFNYGLKDIQLEGMIDDLIDQVKLQSIEVKVIRRCGGRKVVIAESRKSTSEAGGLFLYFRAMGLGTIESLIQN